MRILIITGIFPPDIGGPATYVPFLTQELIRHGHVVSVITLGDVSAGKTNGYEFNVLKIKRSIFKPLRALITILNICAMGRRADILCVNGIYVEAALANIFLNKPVVNKIVGDWAWEKSVRQGWASVDFEQFQRERYGLKIETLKFMRNLYTKMASLNIVPSHYLKSILSGWGVEDNKIKVIYNTVPEVSVSGKKVDIPLATKYNVLTVARLLKHKGIAGLLEIILELKETGLIIIGEGPEKEYLEKYAQGLGIETRVLFAGRLDRRGVISYMLSCDVLVLNSLYEGFPHVVLEAMQCEIPVIATAIGGIPEIIKEGINGFLVSPGDKKMKEKIESLLYDAQLKKVIVSNARETLRLFSAPRIVSDTEEALKNIIENRK